MQPLGPPQERKPPKSNRAPPRKCQKQEGDDLGEKSSIDPEEETLVTRPVVSRAARLRGASFSAESRFASLITGVLGCPGLVAWRDHASLSMGFAWICEAPDPVETITIVADIPQLARAAMDRGSCRAVS